MQTQSRHIGEQWSHIRDHQSRGISESDARELFHITRVEYQPPSKAHLKRLKRERLAVTVARRMPPRDKPEVRAHNATRAKALDIVAINNPHKAAARLGRLSEMFSAKHTVHPFVQSKPAPTPAKPAEPSALPSWRRNRRQREHLIALERMTGRNWKPNLEQACDIFALFGSYKAFIAAAHDNRAAV